MKAAFPVTIVCTLCDERVVIEHSVAITEIGVNSPVRFCPECYAMFCDFRTALRLMPSASCNPESCKGHSSLAANGGVA